MYFSRWKLTPDVYHIFLIDDKNEFNVILYGKKLKCLMNNDSKIRRRHKTFKKFII